jgi:hypothetical protein
MIDARGELGRLVDMQRDGVHEMHRVPVFRQPGCVRTRPATDVEHACGSRWEEPLQELLRAGELEPRTTALQPIALHAGFVVAEEVAVHRLRQFRRGAGALRSLLRSTAGAADRKRTTRTPR